MADETYEIYNPGLYNYNWLVFHPLGWWFQPIWNILVKLHHFPNFRDENNTYWKPPPSNPTNRMRPWCPPQIPPTQGKITNTCPPMRLTFCIFIKSSVFNVVSSSWFFFRQKFIAFRNLPEAIFGHLPCCSMNKTLLEDADKKNVAHINRWRNITFQINITKDFFAIWWSLIK